MDVHVIFYHFYAGHHIYHGYLNALYWAKKNGGAVFTHQEYIDAELYYEDAYFDVFEMERVSKDDKEKIKQVGISKSYFDSLSDKYGRTESVIRLLKERDSYIEDTFEKLIDSIGNVNRIYVFGEVYESIRYIANKRNIQIVAYEFSTVRVASDYSLNLMQACRSGSLYSNNELECRFNDFKSQVPKDMLLSREQLICLLAPLRQIKYLDIRNIKPKYQIGVLNAGYHVVAPFNRYGIHTDDDIMYVCKQLFKENEIGYRRHPGSFSPSDLDRGTQDRDTLPFILSSKRLISISSNALFEAMLWGRTAISAANVIAFSFICENDYKSVKIADDYFINFYLINALVPNQKLLFSDDYWEKCESWSELELFQFNLKCVLEKIGIQDCNNLALNIDEIKYVRGYAEKYNVPNLCAEHPYYDAIESKLIVNNGEKKGAYYCFNYKEGGTIKSEFCVDKINGSILFYPHADKTGFIKIKKILIDGNERFIGDGQLYFIEKYYSFSLQINELATNVTVVVEWEEEENTIKSVKKISDEVRGFQNSTSWKITSPLRKGKSLVKSILRRNK